MLTCNWANSIWIQYRCRHEQRCPECLLDIVTGDLHWSSEQRQFHVYFRCSVMKELQKSKLENTQRKHQQTNRKYQGYLQLSYQKQLTLDSVPAQGFCLFCCFFFTYWELKQLPESTLCHVLFVRQVFDNLRKCFHLISGQTCVKYVATSCYCHADTLRTRLDFRTINK